MKYILQINTGTLEKEHISASEVIEKIDYFLKRLNVTKVIFGWFSDIEYNKQIVKYLKEKNIQSIFKLPIFSEITDNEKEDEFVYLNKLNTNSNKNYYKDDKFDFVCPSSKRNLDYILSIFFSIDSYVNFDGVFFDRIRYPSSALNSNAIFGCVCENCKKIYKDNNINIDSIDINNIKISKRNGLIYEYSDKELNKLMILKRNIITRDVKYLSTTLRKKGKIIGIDTFSPVLTDLVGQDIDSLLDYVDFIKPMNYYKTFAPAGIPYELDGLNSELKESLDKVWDSNLLSKECNIESCKELLKVNELKKKEIAIGIDANYVKGICEADSKYLIDTIKYLEENGIEEVVLSWNALLIDKIIIDKLEVK